MQNLLLIWIVKGLWDKTKKLSKTQLVFHPDTWISVEDVFDSYRSDSKKRIPFRLSLAIYGSQQSCKRYNKDCLHFLFVILIFECGKGHYEGIGM